jgi:asparagine synthase (glutamine-hydrolysing)
MCGIAGYFGGPPSATFAVDALRRLASRGPDGSGVWESVDGGVGLIHTRLAILDLSEAGRQPMEFVETASSLAVRPGGEKCDGHRPTLRVLVFNGEIYNYRELRRDLEAEGEIFVSEGDTEVLLRLLVREGAACLPKLAGMFAFAFWNEATGEALLARDPLGIKPLYYRVDGAALAFASEVRILRQGGDETDASALRDYFLWGSVPDPATLHAAVRQLTAGHCLKWKDGECLIEKWHPERYSKLKTQNSKLSATLTRVALEESMARHLVSDVPVGIFLSGGIDSTVLLALARQILGPAADIRTFSIGFDDPEFDESGIARRTAEHFGALHTEWKMTPEEGAAEIPHFLSAMDQPGIDGFNTWCVSKLARRGGMKVVLSGLGGDELFAGYSSFERVPQFRRWYAGLGILRPAIAGLLSKKPAASPYRRLGAYLQGNGNWLSAYHAQRGIFTPSEAADLARHFAGDVEEADWEISGLPEDPRDIVSRLELTRYMRHQLLRDSDVYSMAHGLELRVPLVDVRLMETISGVAASKRLRQGKQLLLEAVPEVPEWVRNQPKRGFRFPFQSWMESGFNDLLDSTNRESPVPLKAWYRTWAVATAIRSIKANA